VIDLPVMPGIEVVEHQVIKRWCPKCKKWHMPALDLSNEVLGQGRMGHGIASLVSWLRTTLRLPVKLVQAVLQQIYKLKLSVGEIVELTHAVAKAGQQAVTHIKQAIHSSPHVHMDETGWREDGDNGYVWASSTPQGLRAFEFHFSRAGAIPEAILEGFTGTLVTDFYSGYNHTDGRHQRCWVHLLRDLRQLKADHAASYPEVIPWIDDLVKTYHDGKAIAQRDPPPTPLERQTAFNDLLDRVEKLGLKWPKDKGHPAHALCKRLLRHSSELFEFVLQPGLASDNNLAERSVRPLVIARKISGGTRSKQGSDTRMDLQSLFATWAAQGMHALDQCRLMLAAYRPASTPPALP
jgi:transposase